MNSITFNPDKHVLGVLCIQKHEWEKTGLSLRYSKGNGKCVVCNQLWKPEKRLIEFTQNNFPLIDIKRFYLGQLCKRQHLFDNYEYSLRYQKSGACVECYRDRSKNDPVYQEIIRKSYDRIKNSPERKAYEVMYRKTEARRLALKRWNSSEKKRQASCRYIHSEKGKAKNKQLGRMRRARKQLNHAFKYTGDEVKQRFQEFDNCCAYCGSKAVEIDHAIPINSGGPDVLSNFLPSCRNCNVRKSDYELITWFQQQPFFTKQRLKKILKTLGLTEHTLGQLPLF